VTKIRLYPILNFLIAFVWLANGLFCKVLNLVPRHQQIVSAILGSDHSVILTKTIGVLEILMAIWILSNIKSRFCTVAQMLIVGLMNIIEFALVPHLLLFGRVNLIIAMLFISLLYYKEFILKKRSLLKSPDVSIS